MDHGQPPAHRFRADDTMPCSAILAETVHSVVDTFNQVRQRASCPTATRLEHPSPNSLRSGNVACGQRACNRCSCRAEVACWQVLLRVGIVRSRKAPTSQHPYGYLKDKFVWSLVSAVGIFCLGAGITTAHGFSSLMAPPQALENLGYGLTGGCLNAPALPTLCRGRSCRSCCSGLWPVPFEHSRLQQQLCCTERQL